MDSKNPIIGEIRHGKDLLYKGYVTSHSRFQYLACEICGKARWVRIPTRIPGKPRGLTEGKVCKLCAVKIYGANKPGKGSSAWRGGRQKSNNGYINIWLDESDFFYPMANSTHCVREHRLVVAKALGRCLHSWEIVHHKGTKYPLGSKEDKADNRYPENLSLELVNNHTQITIMQNKIKHLQEDNRTLKAKLMDYEILYGNPETDYLCKPLGISPLESLLKVTT